jgi:hypothetical protein
MNNAYEINSSVQRHIVIAENMGEAEKIFNNKYGHGAAKKIELLSCYVLLTEKDEEIEKQDISFDRYEPTYFMTEDGCIIPKMIECPDGDWIKLDEVKDNLY